MFIYGEVRELSHPICQGSEQTHAIDVGFGIVYGVLGDDQD